VERADLLDTRARTIAVREKGAVCKGNKRVDVEVSAVINLYRTEPHIDNAIERFLGTDITDVEQAVRATLEGVLRGVVSELSVEEMSDHEKFAQLLLGSAEDLMDKLGIELRDVVIKSVSELG